MLVYLYLAIIVVANILVSWFGQPILLLTALVLIPVDFVIRTYLQERWTTDDPWNLWLRLLLLLTAGAFLTVISVAGTGRIAVASLLAFIASSLTGAMVYSFTEGHQEQRRTYSLISMSIVDSIIFPIVAFSEVSWLLIIAQAAMKSLVSVTIIRARWIAVEYL